MDKLTQYILIFEAIAKTRHELETANRSGDSLEAFKAYDRLCNLYASIDTDSILFELKQAFKLVA